MLQRFREAAHEARARSRAQSVTSLKRSRAETEPDAAYDATHYFVDDVADPWATGDALERERLSQHAALRELVSRGDVQGLKTRLATLGNNAGLIVNLTPGGANTLLYVASEAGHTAVVAALLEAGADGRAHPVTRYGPLYASAYHGHLDIAKLLLQHFPRAAQQETVEKWLPLHAACIGAHAPLVALLLEHPYPEDVLNTYTDESGKWQYKAAFDVNASDVSGQTALYIACSLGSMPVVEVLLNYSVACEPVPPADAAATSPPAPAVEAARVLSPQRGISLGIHAIVTKLTGGGSKQHIIMVISITCARADCDSLR
ncbi:ankyrin repeat and KH domain-containing protein 1-like [Ostrinia furnacalis]|uniref:ankyrin repeat and KH domain-containing protein 1-like n=1 Tax=Ostrinia furnacalis TaxID=93504 RepID=UPI00103CAC52|nr:ankyrin repeat and KH domain-containing protein 1-like [Ostrinia furnacalis]